MASYIPNTELDRAEMLSKIGVGSIEELFSQIPDSALLRRPLDIPAGMAENRVIRLIGNLAEKNTVFKTIFRGAGSYRHYIPAIVNSVVTKEEFLTAYTPYQPEISQGILQAIFEYQTMICELTGMDSSNASVYDGATAAAEAVGMCKEREKDKKRNKILIASTVHPDILETIKTYCFGSDSSYEMIPYKDGKIDSQSLETLLTGEVSCVFLQQPNFFGIIEDADIIGGIVHQAGARFIMGCNPVALAILKSPLECGADIVTGDGQPLGIETSFGGPGFGFMACKNEWTRKLPGRIVGETTDLDGRRAFVLTLQAREQHIRREKASSNICSNQALCAFTSSVYLSAMGPSGLREVAVQSVSKAHYLAQRLLEIDGFTLKFEEAFFHEFVTQSRIPNGVILQALERNGILGGLPLRGELEGCLLWCATEENTKEEIDRMVQILKGVCAK